MTSKDQAFVEFAQHVMDLHRERSFPYPPVLKQNGPGSDIIALEFWSIDAAKTWAVYFNAPEFAPYDHPVLPVLCVLAAAKYHGWEIQISARERIKKAA